MERSDRYDKKWYRDKHFSLKIVLKLSSAYLRKTPDKSKLNS